MIKPIFKLAMCSMLLSLFSTAQAGQLLSEDEMRQVTEINAEAGINIEQGSQQVKYLQQHVEQDQEDVTLPKPQPVALNERQSALMSGKITPAMVAEENYRDWLLSSLQ